MSRKKRIRNTVLTAALWMLVWQLAAVWIDSSIFLPSPLDMLKSLKTLFMSAEFFHSVVFSLGNIAKGFLLGVGIGILLAAIAVRSEFLRAFIALPMRIIKATPVASFTILALLWVPSGKLSVLISFLMVLPILYTNVLTGIEATDEKLLEMGRVFKIRWYHKLRYLYVPAVLPHLLAACSVAIGLAWKSGIAAEVIGITKNSIGNHLYQAKIYLEIPELFAWTAVTVVISILFEQVVLLLIHGTERLLLGKGLLPSEEQTEMPVPLKPEKKKGTEKTAEIPESKEYGARDIVLDKVEKQYDGRKVLSDISLRLSADTPVAVMGSSGIGKTTLLRLVLGVEKPDAGEIRRGKEAERFAVVFQENRLCEQASAVSNLLLVCKTKAQREQAFALLEQLGLSSCARQRTVNLSGGMKRRLAIGRALLSDAPVLLLDEPFQGLDEETKRQVMSLVKTHMAGKTVLLITHDKKEAEFLGCDRKQL